MIRLSGFVLCFLLVSVVANARCPSLLFTSISDRVLSQSYQEFATGSVTFKNSVESHALIRSSEVFEKAGALIQGAKRNIFVQTWYFDHTSEPAKIFAAELAKLSRGLRQRGQKNPVHIWIMVNVVGFQNAGHERREIERFFADYDLNNAFTQLHIGIFKAKLLGANHAKSISVDNTVAVITGANIFDYVNELSLFDLGFVVRGQIVHQINADFVDIWHQYIGSEPAPKLEKLALRGKPTQNCLPIMYAKNNAYANISTTIRHSALNQALLNSVRAAKKSIDIITPNLNVEPFRQAIKEAIEAKVKVRIILSKGFLALEQNLPSRGGENLVTVTKLYRALSDFSARGYFCNQLQIRWFSRDGEDAVKGLGTPKSHAKFMVVDGRVTYIGSANMDNQSWVNSREIGLFIDSRSHARQWLKQFFEPSFAKATPVRECGGPVEPTIVFPG